MKNLNISNKIRTAAGLILYAVSAAMIAFSVYLCFSPDIWYDELFSMEFALRPISEMVKLTAADVHPPLYYILVHLMVKFGAAISIDNITAAKLASVVPFIFIFIYGITVVRKRIGVLFGGLFILAVIAMPNISEYAVEIRMYSWLILFITALCIHAEDFILSDGKEPVKGLEWKKILPIFLYGLMACYTQYYAAVAVAFVYLYLIIYSIRKNIYQLGILLISANMTAVLYFPWISVIMSQVGTVSQNYWIQPLTIRSFGGIVKYLVLPAFTIKWVALLFAALLFLLSCFTVFRSAKNTYMWLYFMPIIGIVIFGFAASVLIKPIFVYRYMLPGMGAFWYGIIVAVADINADGSKNHENRKSNESNECSESIECYERNESNECNESKMPDIFKVCSLALSIVMAIVCIRGFCAFRGNELYKRVNMEKTQQLFDELKADDELVVITNFDHVDGLTAFYLGSSEADTEVLLYNSEPEELIRKLLPNTSSIEGSDSVRKLLEEGKHVIFLGSFNQREEIVSEWENEQGIKSENLGSYLLERYWVDVFELSL